MPNIFKDSSLVLHDPKTNKHVLVTSKSESESSINQLKTTKGKKQGFSVRSSDPSKFNISINGVNFNTKNGKNPNYNINNMSKINPITFSPNEFSNFQRKMKEFSDTTNKIDSMKKNHNKHQNQNNKKNIDNEIFFEDDIKSLVKKNRNKRKSSTSRHQDSGKNAKFENTVRNQVARNNKYLDNENESKRNGRDGARGKDGFSVVGNRRAVPKIAMNSRLNDYVPSDEVKKNTNIEEILKKRRTKSQLNFQKSNKEKSNLRRFYEKYLQKFNTKKAQKSEATEIQNQTIKSENNNQKKKKHLKKFMEDQEKFINSSEQLLNEITERAEQKSKQNKEARKKNLERSSRKEQNTKNGKRGKKGSDSIGNHLKNKSQKEINEIRNNFLDFEKNQTKLKNSRLNKINNNMQNSDFDNQVIKERQNIQKKESQKKKQKKEKRDVSNIIMDQNNIDKEKKIIQMEKLKKKSNKKKKKKVESSKDGKKGKDGSLKIANKSVKNTIQKNKSILNKKVKKLDQLNENKDKRPKQKKSKVLKEKHTKKQREVNKKSTLNKKQQIRSKKKRDGRKGKDGLPGRDGQDGGKGQDAKGRNHFKNIKNKNIERFPTPDSKAFQNETKQISSKLKEKIEEKNRITNETNKENEDDEMAFFRFNNRVFKIPKNLLNKRRKANKKRRQKKIDKKKSLTKKKKEEKILEVSKKEEPDTINENYNILFKARVFFDQKLINAKKI